jgi:catechol 2,3-dioxygenase-like lactoylglutathione lyase family enzyme
MDMEVHQPDASLWRCVGPARQILISQGPAGELAGAGFACRDEDGLNALHGRAHAEGLNPVRSEEAWFHPGAFAVRDPDGNRIAFGLGRHDAAQPPGLRGPLQHLTLASRDVEAIERFYAGQLGFAVSDRVRNREGKLMTCFMRSNHEHHTLACFYQDRRGVDHHSYEAGEWTVLRDWCDRASACGVPLMWGPGRHGPGNNLFIFLKDPDGNWIEISAELEVVLDRPVREWPHEKRTLNLWGEAILRA